MDETGWNAVDRYFSALFAPHDEALEAALNANRAAGLPDIGISAGQAKFLHLLARMQNPRAILEIGTLGGYSAIWLARALAPGGRLITLEAETKHAEIARANIERAGLSACIELRCGFALDELPKLEQAGLHPFDFIFIDADKPNNPDYFAWALKLSRPGSLIVIDNVVRGGLVADAATGDANVEGVRRMNQAIAAEPRVSAAALQTVGSKGYDGFALVLVNA